MSSAIWSTGKQLVFKPEAASALNHSAQLDPRFEYLYVTVRDSSFFATKIREQTTPEGVQEIWLTPANEVFRTLDGRITSTTGSLYAEWTQSSTSGLSSWGRIVQQTQSGRALSYQRTRDVEPGGLVGLKEQVTVSAIAPPKSHRLIPTETAKDLYWVEERSESLDRAGRVKHAQLQSIEQQENPLSQALPPSRFALRVSAIPHSFTTKNTAIAADWVYAEQCLSYKVCLSMQRWPLPQTATSAATQ